MYIDRNKRWDKKTVTINNVKKGMFQDRHSRAQKTGKTFDPPTYACKKFI